MVTHPTVAPYSDRTPQREDVPLRFHATTFGKFLEKAREVAGVTRETFIETVNEIITKKNEHLPSKDKIQTMTLRVYGNMERKERYPAFEELVVSPLNVHGPWNKYRSQKRVFRSKRDQ